MQISPIDNIDDCVSNNKSLNVITEHCTTKEIIMDYLQ